MRFDNLVKLLIGTPSKVKYQTKPLESKYFESLRKVYYILAKKLTTVL